MNDPRTDAELNRIIAEWMGWTHCHEWTPFGSGVMGNDPDGMMQVQAPSFCTDLNACREAEHLICMGWFKEYKYALRVACSDPTYPCLRELEECFMANARQRAEALVKVIEEETT